ncbi:hypothetical protein A1O3_02938 [Capronia epimyces CBS 606.96]|uniref:Uncharacterized protein n=1 Tax=Capronia epimyces CBS 606.96 TaxID=1182542 RepID=W9YKY0_9EURO|nr:uncharacterized protein A1O3_02938 [Capronia epimyces CBS 606.96]EXJ89871.1 hypothetical protein A1O3_02938 [Capronia epimyces CBS 606.96]
MVSGKKRLYIALYPSGVTGNEERRYHWGFLVGPKVERKSGQVPGTQYHVKNRPLQGWAYEAIPHLNIQTTDNLLARVLIAKVEDEQRLVSIFETTPVVQDDPDWRCRTWVADALSRIEQDGHGRSRGRAVGTAELNWSSIEPVARAYVANKTTAGRYLRAVDLSLPKPTWDMLQRREIVP